jgi:hypothetical protein
MRLFKQDIRSHQQLDYHTSRATPVYESIQQRTSRKVVTQSAGLRPISATVSLRGPVGDLQRRLISTTSPIITRTPRLTSQPQGLHPDYFFNPNFGNCCPFCFNAVSVPLMTLLIAAFLPPSQQLGLVPVDPRQHRPSILLATFRSDKLGTRFTPSPLFQLIFFTWG